MKLLLDTHAFIWWDSEPEKLSAKVLALCQSQENTLVLSVVSVWEIQIKNQLGKLNLGTALTEIIENQNKINKIKVLPISLGHVLYLDKLPNHHKDPFDRLLIAQANTEGFVLVSKDTVFTKYPVNVVW
ncbi:MAG: twitching motility protein PilT [Desulfobacteraceae bacterium IS3]|nr:MAG: twitching motility protein PilT [Desulfobacteraceae bacterium IS3]